MNNNQQQVVELDEPFPEMSIEEQEIEDEIERDEAEQDAADGTFDDLDSLLNESVTLVKAAKEVKAAKLTLKHSASIMSATERQYIEAKVAAWEAEHTWKTIELVAVFRRQVCACGSVHITFSHFMHHQQHRRNSFTQRWVSATFGPDSSTPDLPRNVAYSDSLIPMCADCSEASGFSLTSPTARAWEAQTCGELQHAK